MYDNVYVCKLSIIQLVPLCGCVYCALLMFIVQSFCYPLWVLNDQLKII